jgi:hypothetical protein
MIASLSLVIWVSQRLRITTGLVANAVGHSESRMEMPNTENATRELTVDYQAAGASVGRLPLAFTLQ